MGRPVHRHKVSVVADGREVSGWTDYNVSVDMLQPADSFSLGVRFTRQAYELLALDVEVGIFIDGAQILTGYIGQREKVPSDNGTMLRIAGRDKTGRLVDESSELFGFGGLYLKELAEKICGIGTADAIFQKVTLRNVKNRSLLRGVRQEKIRVNLDPLLSPVAGVFRPGLGQVGIKVPKTDSVTVELDAVERDKVNLDPVIGPIAEGARAAAAAVGVNLPRYRGGAEYRVGPYVRKAPIINPGIFEGRAAPKKVQPGQTRWSVLEEFLREARLLAWSTGDGKEIFIGLPTYEQDVSYLFYEAGVDSKNRRDTNASITIRENVEEMYALYMACGASRGDGAAYGANVIKRIGRARDNPDTRSGVGVNFRRPKTLLISDDGVRSQRDAEERAEREKLQREQGFREALISTAGHGQLYDDERVIFAVDTMAQVVDEDTGTNEPMLVTSVHYRGGIGTTTELRAVPKGTLLSL